MKSLLKKIALMFPTARRVKEDLHNRRLRADEYEAANNVLKERNTELQESLEFMKSQMAKALALKDTAISAESSLAAKAEHYHGQLSVMTARYNALKAEYETLETENLVLRLTNDGLLNKKVIGSRAIRSNKA